MSQLGAIRWAKGTTCPNGTVADWPASGTTSPIQWDYKQILAHYYTGVQFINDNTGAPFAPDDRWNLLKYESIPDTMTSGQQITASIWLQNTSTQPWTDAVLGYQWLSNDPQVPPSAWVTTNIPNLPNQSNMPAGSDQNISVTITAPTNGTYNTLRFDVKRGASGAWFSTAGWPDAQIDVHVNGATATDTPTPTPTATGTATFMPTISLSTPTFTPTATPTLSPPIYFLTYTGMSYGCTSYYVGCVAVVEATQTDSYRWDFDITYQYNKYWTGLAGLYPCRWAQKGTRRARVAVMGAKARYFSDFTIKLRCPKMAMRE